MNCKMLSIFMFFLMIYIIWGLRISEDLWFRNEHLILVFIGLQRTFLFSIEFPGDQYWMGKLLQR